MDVFQRAKEIFDKATLDGEVVLGVGCACADQTHDKLIVIGLQDSAIKLARANEGYEIELAPYGINTKIILLFDDVYDTVAKRAVLVIENSRQDAWALTVPGTGARLSPYKKLKDVMGSLGKILEDLLSMKSAPVETDDTNVVDFAKGKLH